VRLALAAAALLAAALAVRAEEPPKLLAGTVTMSVQSGALWRGERLTDVPTAVLLPSVALKIADLVSVWGEIAYDTHTQTILRRRGNRLVPETHRYREQDVGISISKDTKIAEVSLDASLTHLAEGAGNPAAATLGFVSHAPLSPGLEVTRDLGASDNWYFAPKLEPKVTLAEGLDLEMRASVGWYAGASLQTRFFGGETAATTRYSGISDASASARLAFSPGAFTVAVKGIWATFLSEEVRRRVGQIGQPRSTLLGQLSLSVDF
jgi:hypothetical protein